MAEGKENSMQGKRIDEIIARAAREAANEVVRTQHRRRGANLYRATERLLRSYPKLRHWEEHPEEYGFFPTGTSHDTSVAPPPGLGLRDKVALNEEFVAARRASYERTMARYYDIKAVVEQFEQRPEFVVIRMYYFGEDARGHDRGPGAKPYTFEEIASELATVGIERSAKTLRIWRSTLVQEMTVLLFGIDGAVSVEERRLESPRDSKSASIGPTADGEIEDFNAAPPAPKKDTEGRC